MKITHNQFQQFLTLFFLCLILFKSTIIFAATEDANKPVNTYSEEMEEQRESFKARESQKNLTSEAGERVKEKADIKKKGKSDVVKEVINKAVVEKIVVQ